jgi:hypothetical protein
MRNLTDKQVNEVIILLREHIDAIVQELEEQGYTRAEALHILSLWVQRNCATRHTRPAMPLKIDSLSQSERQFLADNLPATDDPTQVQSLAARLLDQMVRDPKLLDQAVREIGKLLGFRRQQESTAEAISQSRFYQFGVQSDSQPQYMRQYKVHDYDFSKFCSHFGLSERSMLRLAAGEVDSYKGWVQGSVPGNLGKRRAEYLREHNPHPAGQTAPVLYQGEPPASYSTKAMLPSEWWTPPAE